MYICIYKYVYVYIVTYIMYIYIYMCVCVCMCVCFYRLWVDWHMTFPFIVKHSFFFRFT